MNIEPFNFDGFQERQNIHSKKKKEEKKREGSCDQAFPRNTVVSPLSQSTLGPVKLFPFQKKK